MPTPDLIARYGRNMATAIVAAREERLAAETALAATPRPTLTPLADADIARAFRAAWDRWLLADELFWRLCDDAADIWETRTNGR